MINPQLVESLSALLPEIKEVQFIKVVDSQVLAACIHQKLQIFEANSIDHNMDAYRNSIRQISEVLLKYAYTKNHIIKKPQNIIAFLSLAQFIIHKTGNSIAKNIKNCLNVEGFNMVCSLTISEVYELKTNSIQSFLIKEFYEMIQKIYIKRVKNVCSLFKMKMLSNSFSVFQIFLSTFLQDLKEQQSKDHTATLDHLILSIVYLILCLFYSSISRSKVIFTNILNYFADHSSKIHQIELNITALSLITFYNQRFLPKYLQLNAAYPSFSKDLQCLVDEERLPQGIVSNNLFIIVQSIDEQGGTVLDNIVFTSSWES